MLLYRRATVVSRRTLLRISVWLDYVRIFTPWSQSTPVLTACCLRHRHTMWGNP